MRLIITTLTLAAVSLCCLAQETPAKQSNKPAGTAETVTKDTDSTPVKLDPKGEAHPPSIWMQQKLKHSQNVFAGMVSGDLVQVEESAQYLQLVNRLESFARRRSPEYRTQLRVFRYANNEILKGAKEKNLNRVTLGYNQLTVSCVACHQQLRHSEAP